MRTEGFEPTQQSTRFTAGPDSPTSAHPQDHVGTAARTGFEPAALPLERRATLPFVHRAVDFPYVGMAGLEPTASAPPVQRATKLRHIPFGTRPPAASLAP